MTFDVTNDGQTVHNLEVEGNGVEEVTDDIEPGGSRLARPSISSPATYEIYCAIGDHASSAWTAGHGRVAGPPPSSRLE